jgi:hypothetical protein
MSRFLECHDRHALAPCSIEQLRGLEFLGGLPLLLCLLRLLLLLVADLLLRLLGERMNDEQRAGDAA